MRHRAGERVALPLHRGAVRGRGIRAFVFAVLGGVRAAHSRDGVRGGPGEPEGRRAQLRRAGAGRVEMASVQVGGPCGQLPADDVLHHGCRMDAGVHGVQRRGHVRGPGRRRRPRGVQRASGRPAYDGRVHAGRSADRRVSDAGRLAQRRGAHYEDDDGRPVRRPCRAGGARGHASGRRRGPVVLSHARFREAVRRRVGDVRRCRVRGYGPGVLHGVGGRGVHVHLRQLHR